MCKRARIRGLWPAPGRWAPTALAGFMAGAARAAPHARPAVRPRRKICPPPRTPRRRGWASRGTSVPRWGRLSALLGLAEGPQRSPPPSSGDHSSYAAAMRSRTQERPPAQQRPQPQRVVGGAGGAAAQARPASGARPRVVVQPAPQRPGTLSAPLQPTPEALLRIYRGAPRVSAVQPARNWREADFAPLHAEGIRDIAAGKAVGDWPVPDQPSVFSEVGLLGLTLAGGGPRQGRRNSSDLAPGRRSVRGHLGPTRGPRQLLRPGASPGCGLRAQHIGPLWGSVALSGSARARRLAVRGTRGGRPVPTGARPPLAMAARARGRRRRRRHGRTRGGRRRGRGGGSAPPPRETTRPCRPSASLSVSIPRC